MPLRRCAACLCASLSPWRGARPACHARAQPPCPTPPPRPSRRDSGIGPEGATSLVGPLATLTKLEILDLRYGWLPWVVRAGRGMSDDRWRGGGLKGGGRLKHLWLSPIRHMFLWFSAAWPLRVHARAHTHTLTRARARTYTHARTHTQTHTYLELPSSLNPSAPPPSVQPCISAGPARYRCGAAPHVSALRSLHGARPAQPPRPTPPPPPPTPLPQG